MSSSKITDTSKDKPKRIFGGRLLAQFPAQLDGYWEVRWFEGKTNEVSAARIVKPNIPEEIQILGQLSNLETCLALTQILSANQHIPSHEWTLGEIDKIVPKTVEEEKQLIKKLSLRQREVQQARRGALAKSVGEFSEIIYGEVKDTINSQLEEFQKSFSQKNSFNWIKLHDLASQYTKKRSEALSLEPEDWDEARQYAREQDLGWEEQKAFVNLLMAPIKVDSGGVDLSPYNVDRLRGVKNPYVLWCDSPALVAYEQQLPYIIAGKRIPKQLIQDARPTLKGIEAVKSETSSASKDSLSPQL